jgi:hypothetical protein
MYHDFYGPSQIWVNISHDGGATFGAPQEVLASPAVTPGTVTGTLVTQGYTFCNTVPAGVQIVKPGLPQAGRIYVAWIAALLAQNATGCNISMLQSFHTLWVSYSDDNGVTWTPQQAFDAGIGHDASTPFVGFTTDDQGNRYFGFGENLNSNPATCSAESTAGTVQSDPSCEYDMYVVWSSNGALSWNGGGGLVPGSAAKPYRVNWVRETGTHFFPAIAAGDPWTCRRGLSPHPGDPPHRPLRKGRSRRLRGARAGQRQSHHVSTHVELEPLRRPVAEPDPEAGEGDLDDHADHHHPDARRRHLQPGHRLCRPQLQSQPARLHQRDGRPQGLRSHHLCRRQHRQQAPRRQPDHGALRHWQPPRREHDNGAGHRGLLLPVGAAVAWVGRRVRRRGRRASVS